ncbi:hypothetical protein [Halorussus sp. AFM4]|uniref:hypothetical protein n=1 Tax=Halorussus sp. AFM4 TaxID=3421651 RepID=UPI003EB75E8A
MYDLLTELGSEALGLVAYAVGTLALSAVGLVAEYNSLRRLAGGDALLAAWFGLMGLVALAFAANLGRDELIPRLAADE